jgi:hypothetical protein
VEPTAPLPRYNRRSSHQSAPAKVCGEFCLVQPLKPGPPRNPTASLCRFSVALAPLGSSGILQITRTPAPAPTPYAPHDQIDQQEWPPRATLTVLWGYPALNTCRATGAMAQLQVAARDRLHAAAAAAAAATTTRRCLRRPLLTSRASAPTHSVPRLQCRAGRPRHYG